MEDLNGGDKVVIVTLYCDCGLICYKSRRGTFNKYLIAIKVQYKRLFNYRDNVKTNRYERG